MKKLISLGIVVAFLSCNLIAQGPARFFPSYATETITVSNSAATFTATKVSDPNNSVNRAALAAFTVNCASGTSCVLRFWTTGDTPTSSQGMRAAYGQQVLIYNFVDIQNFKGIRETSTDVKIDVEYFR